MTTPRPERWISHGLEWIPLLDLFGSASYPVSGVWFEGEYVLGGVKFSFDPAAEAQAAWAGAAWTSHDGVEWQELNVPQLAGAPIWGIARYHEGLIATGPAVLCAIHCDTGAWADAGSVVSRATSAGDWQAQVWPPGLRHGLARDLAVSGSLVVSLGLERNPDYVPGDSPYPSGQEAMVAAWASTDGLKWKQAVDFPPGYVMGSLAQNDGNFVSMASGGWGGEGSRLLWSKDGLHWRTTLETSYVEALVASPHGFTAVLEHFLDRRVVVSSDGRRWHQVETAGPFDSIGTEVLTWLRDRYFVLAWSDGEGDEGGSLKAWFSAEGRAWSEADLPPAFDREVWPFRQIQLGDALLLGSQPGATSWLIRPVSH